MSERLYMRELQSDLLYKDRRSIRRWCKSQNVRLLSDKGSNRQYVLKEEYEKAKYKNYYPSTENTNESEIFLNLYNKGAEKSEPKYQPQFENELKTLSILHNI